eukprot:UN09326
MPMNFTMTNFASQCQIALHNYALSCHHQHRGMDRCPCANCTYTGGGSLQLIYFPSTEPVVFVSHQTQNNNNNDTTSTGTTTTKQHKNKKRQRSKRHT